LCILEFSGCLPPFFGIGMDKVLAWLKGRRVFPRWKLIVMVLSGVLAGLFIALGEWPGAIIVLLGLHELSKRESDKA